MSTRQSLDHLNRASRDEFVAALGGIFEHSPWVAEAVAGKRPFASLTDLHAAMLAEVEKADAERQLALIRLHPDLAGKAAQAGTMTDHSKAEQAGARLNKLSPWEFAKFQELNGSYTDKFGFPFIVCVRRHTLTSIFRNFEERLKNNREQEYAAALQEISRIASLRLDQIVESQDGLGLNGRFVVQVVDNTLGRPAANLDVELREALPYSGYVSTLQAKTAPDGVATLIDGRPVPNGTYEVRLPTGEYFKKTGGKVSDPPFLPTVCIGISLSDPEGSHRLQVAITPWSYSVSRV
jgi:2-oxo-4-hydroxy-4-carboxy-5-ureidoimidazoline decarboxylase